MGNAPNEPAINSRHGKFWAHAAYYDSNVCFPAPYVQFTGKPFADNNNVIYDSNGFRNSESITVERKTNEIRILALGDSTVYAGPSNEETVPGLVQQLLRRAISSDLFVYNFGGVSYCLNQMSNLLMYRLLKYSPDVIFVIGGVTDLFQPYTFDPRPGYPYNSFMVEYLYDYFFDPSNGQMRDQGLSYIQLMQYSSEHLERLRIEIGWKTPEWERMVILNVHRAVSNLAMVADYVKIPIVFVRQPLVVRKSYVTESEKNTASPEFLAYLSRQYRHLDSTLQCLNNQMIKNKYFYITDAVEIFDGVKEQIFTDMVHYTQNGRLLMAKFVAQHITEILKTHKIGRKKGFFQHLLRW